MPPHCDTIDGPVVTAASKALEAKDVTIVLPYVPKDSEREVIESFASAARVREMGGEALEIADRFFFEKVVRLHRTGEGESFTGLKPAGLDHGPIIPLAEQAIQTGNPEDMIKALCDVVDNRVRSQLRTVRELADSATPGDIDSMRACVSAELGFEVWSHKLLKCAGSAAMEAKHHLTVS